MSRQTHSERRAAFKIRYSEGDEPIPGYRLIKRLGQGGVGQVFKAIGPGGVAVALKIISGLDQAGGRKELRALQNVKNIGHANLVAIHGFWLKDEDGHIIEYNADDETPPDSADSGSMRPAQLFVVMRLCEGSLYDRFLEYRKKGLSGIPTEELIGYLEDAAKAIDYLNNRCNMQHCDIKPHNILIVGGTAQVCDYGLVKEVDDPHRSTNMVSPLYAAPELLPLSAKEPGPSRATDQCSLGMSYVELRTGRLPFAPSVNPDNPFQVMQAVGQGQLDLSRLDESERKVIARATARNPDDRYESCVKMVRELRRAAEGAGTDTNARIETQPVLPVAPYRHEYQEGDEAVPGYRLLRKIGEEGPDKLFLAAARDGSTVALKIIHDLDEATGRRELTYLQKMRDIRHPYLVPVFGVWLKYEDGTLVDSNLALDERISATVSETPVPRRAQVFVAAQPCEGNLRDRLSECLQLGKDGIPADELAGYIEEAARAIDYLNQVHGVAHRDIKPQNILLVGGVALVGNFGLARNPYDPRRGIDDPVPYFAAPELLPQPGLSGERAALPTSDLYSLAVSYIELRTGRLPFRSMMPGEVISAIAAGRLDISRLSAPEQRVLKTATALDATERQASAVQFSREMRAALAEHSRNDAQQKSAEKSVHRPPADELAEKIKAPFKLRYEPGDEPIPGYRLEARVGEAGVDDVFRAVGPDGEKTALKICYELDELEARDELRFLQRMSSVRHPHLVEIDDLWLKTDDGVVVGPAQLGDDPLPEPVESGSRPPRGAQLFIAMPLCEGNLADRLRKAQREGSPGIPPEELLGYFEEAAKAVDFLQTVLGISHCNLKPQNILLLNNVAQLGDLSSSRTPLDLRGTLDLLVPYYAPPELLPVGDADPSPAPTSDEYSLAMCYAELRTGKLPLRTENVVEAMLAISTGELDLSAVDERERQILAKALSLDPKERFASATKMVRALRRAVEGASTGISRIESPVRLELKSPFQARYAEGDEPIPGHRLLERLGASGYDEVFRAAGPGAKKIALKIVYGLDETGARREFRLLQRAKEIRHSHLVDIDDIWLKDEQGNVFDQNTLPDEPGSGASGGASKAAQIFFSMPLSESSLAEQLSEVQKTGGKGIPRAELIGYLESAAKAIDHLNNVHGTPHGAIEPRHLLILGGAIRLSDFALSRDRPHGIPLTEPVPPYYTAPELLAEGAERPLANVRTDQYALAMSYVHLSTGQLPFRSADPGEVRKAILNRDLDLSALPPAERQVVAKALAFRPAKRYATSGEFVRALRPMIDLPEMSTFVESGSGGTPAPRYPIKGKYVQGDMPVPGHKLISLIGRGGFGDVWKASSPGGIREVALKIVYDAGGQLGQRELLGLWQIKKIRHENMVPIVALWIKDPQGNLVDDDAIANLERDLFVAEEPAPLGRAEPGAGTVLGSATRTEGTLIARDGATKAASAQERSPMALTEALPPAQERSGTLIFARPQAPVVDRERSISQGAVTRAKTLSDEPPQAPRPARAFEPAQLFIAMELCDGHLLHRLNSCKQEGLSGIPPQELLGYMDLAADVIDEFNIKHHTRHRDIKPQNLLQIGKTLKVCDFGLVRRSAGASKTQGLAFTPEYAAPEQVRGEDSPTTDQYCLAVTYCQLRTGCLPFRRTEIHEIIGGKSLSDEDYEEFLDLSRHKGRERRVLERALARDPAARYGSCKEFAIALREAVFPPAPPPRPQRQSWLLPATVAALLLLCAGVFAAWYLLTPPPVERSLEGTLLAVEEGGGQVTVQDAAGREQRVKISPETIVILNRTKRERADLRPGQIVTARFMPGQPALQVDATSPEMDEKDVSRLVNLVNEGKLEVAFDEAARMEDPASAEGHIERALLRRSQRLLASDKTEDLQANCAEAFMARGKYPENQGYKSLRARAVVRLLTHAEELSADYASRAETCFEYVEKLLQEVPEDEETALWRRETLWGLVRVAAGSRPLELERLQRALANFEDYQAARQGLPSLDEASTWELRALRVICAVGGPPAVLAAHMEDLLAAEAWRERIPADWQRERIDALSVELVDQLEQESLAPELREVVGKLLDFEGFLVRANAKLALEPPRFDLAKTYVELARNQAGGDEEREKRISAALAEIEILDPKSSGEDAASAFLAAIRGFSGEKEAARRLVGVLVRRLKENSSWLTEPLVTELIGEARRLAKEGSRGADFDLLHGLLAARNLVFQYALRGSYDGELRDDFTRARHKGVPLAPDVRAVVETIYAESRLKDAPVEELRDLGDSLASAAQTLGSGEFGKLAACIKAFVEFRADANRAVDVATVVFESWKEPPAYLGVEARQEAAAQVLVAGAVRLLAPLRDDRYGLRSNSQEQMARALEYLQLASKLLGRDVTLSGAESIAALALAEISNPDWPAIRERTEKLLADSAQRETIKKEGWLGRLYLASGRAHHECAKTQKQPEYLPAAVAHYEAAFALLSSQQDEPERVLAVCREILAPALEAADAGKDSAKIPAASWARLLAAKGRFLRDDSQLADVLMEKSAYLAAYNAFARAAELEPNSLEYLVGKAHAWDELPHKDKGESKLNLAGLVEAARGAPDAMEHPGVRGLIGKLRLAESKAIAVDTERANLLGQAIEEYEWAREHSTPADAEYSSYILGLSYAHLEYAFFNSIDPAQKKPHLQEAAKFAEMATRLRPPPKRMDYAYIAWGNALEDLALYVFVERGQEFERKDHFAQAERKFTQAKDVSLGGEAALSLGRCIYRRTLRCEWTPAERLTGFQDAERELRAALQGEHRDWRKRAEANYWIGECLVGKSVLETDAKEKQAILKQADGVFETAVQEARRMGLLELPEMHLRWVSFAAQVALTGGAMAADWRAKSQARLEQMFADQEINASAATRLKAFSHVFAAAQNATEKIALVTRHLDKFAGEGDAWKACQAELKLLRGERCYELRSSAEEWKKHEILCLQDADEALKLINGLDERLTERKTELKQRALMLLGNYHGFLHTSATNPSESAKHLIQAERYLKDAIELAATDYKSSAYARYNLANLLARQIPRLADSDREAAERNRKSAYELLRPIAKQHLSASANEQTLYESIEILRRRLQ